MYISIHTPACIYIHTWILYSHKHRFPTIEVLMLQAHAAKGLVSQSLFRLGRLGLNGKRLRAAWFRVSGVLGLWGVGFRGFSVWGM